MRVPRLPIPALPVLILASTLTGCGVTGSGIAPYRLQIFSTSATDSSETEARAYQCFPIPLKAVLYFTDGSTGDFTGRATWSSSFPGVAQVSNGDIPAPASGDYDYGTVIQGVQGTTTVTASFEGIAAHILISVGAASGFTMQNVINGVPTPAAKLDVGVSTLSLLKIYGTFDGIDRDVTAAAVWSVDEPGLADVQQPESSAVEARLTGLGAGGPTSVVATFPTCGESERIPLTVESVQGIEIDPEFGTAPLIVGNNERMDVMADLADGSKQNIDAQATLVADDPDIAAFNAGLPYLLNALEPGTASVSATFNNQFTAPDAALTTIDTNLQSVSVTPSSATLVVGSNDIVPFVATGTYDNGQTQDITRIVKWASSNTSIATVGSTVSNAGQATPASGSIGAPTGQVQITATDSAASEFPVAAAELNVGPPP